MSAGHMLPPRERKFLAASIDDVSASGSFSGYASVFGKVDLGRDLVEPGAFAGSLRQRGVSAIRMLFQHDPAEPIGIWEQISEDARGLYVRGRLSLGSARAREVHALMRSGALDGLSIGFRAIKTKRDGRSGVRRILEADLWEISIVTFPMLPDARIASVKGAGAARRRPARQIRGSIFHDEAGLAAAIRRATVLMKERNRRT